MKTPSSNIVKFTGLQTEGKSHIRGITLANFLQMMRAEQKNCTLKVTSANRTGFLYIHQGELLDAELEELSGKVAALELVVWEDVEIEMEDTCWRHKKTINCSMEHILLDAFQRKDEQMHRAGKVQQDSFGKVSPVQRLQKYLHESSEITEYIIFDQQRLAMAKNPGKCTLATFDPDIFTHLMKQFDSLLSFGSCNFLSFNTSNQSSYLFFHCVKHMVLLKLQSGSEPQPVVKKIKCHCHSHC